MPIDVHGFAVGGNRPAIFGGEIASTEGSLALDDQYIAVPREGALHFHFADFIDAFLAVGRIGDVIIHIALHSAGRSKPYVLDRLAGKGPRILAIEPSACPTLTRGKFTYDYGDTAKLTPLVKMFTLGDDFVPPASMPVGCATTELRR